MSTPHDPQGAGHPDQGPYGGQPYGPPGQLPPYGQQPQYPGSQYPTPGQYGGPPPQGAYGGQPQPGYAYSPYGSTPYAAGLDQADGIPVRRPGLMILSLILSILASLPFLAAGLVFLLIPLSAATLPPGLFDDPRLAQAGLTIDTLIAVARVAGAILVGVALVYLVFAVLAFVGRNWARIILTVLTVGFSLLLLAGVIGGASDTGTLAFAGGLLIALIGSVVILFLPASSAFFSRIRR